MIITMDLCKAKQQINPDKVKESYDKFQTARNLKIMIYYLCSLFDQTDYEL